MVRMRMVVVVHDIAGAVTVCRESRRFHRRCDGVDANERRVESDIYAAADEIEINRHDATAIQGAADERGLVGAIHASHMQQNRGVRGLNSH